MGIVSGLFSLGTRLLGGAAGAAVPRIAGGAAAAGGGGFLGGALSTIGRALTAPLGQGIIGGGLGGLAATFLGGDGAAAAPAQISGFAGAFGGQVQVLPGSPLGLIMAQGIAVSPLVGGRFMATAPNGDFQIFNRQGFPVRPSSIIPAGQRLPGGALVVSTRQQGALIGITQRRRRRTFAGEVDRTRRVIQNCRIIERLCQPQKRRSGHK